jgi:glycosyltransferase involved in cell wall biosynthesis
MRDSSGGSPSRLRHQRVRVYRTLRTAHLERAHEFVPSSIVYVGNRYDFDEQLTAGLDVHRCATLSEMAALLARSDVRELEINEPLMLASCKLSLVAVAASRLGSRRHGHRTMVATYALVNYDHFRGANRRLRSRTRRVVYRALVRLLIRNVDRIAFGTAGAAEQYRSMTERRGPALASALIPALPAPCERCPPPAEVDGGKEKDRVVFLAAFDHRKGLTQLLEAWPILAARRPGAHLRVLGKGRLEHLAVEAARQRAEVEVVIDPSRDRVHEELRSARALVLLSQPSRVWREQIGLPIVEGLAHGCEIVATTETGLASWLADHGHQVLPPTASAERVAEAIGSSLDSGRSATEILATLPPLDGRTAAERWMFRDPAGPRAGAS